MEAIYAVRNFNRGRFQKFKTELFDELKKMNVGGSAISDHRKWLRSAEVWQLLNISVGTLQNLRINGTQG